MYVVTHCKFFIIHIERCLMMLFIHKKLIRKLTTPYIEANTQICYAQSQSFASYSSKTILLLNHDKLIILFLNFFSSKVIHTLEIPVTDLQEQNYNTGSLLDALWSFQSNGQRWRFRIIKKILPLGTMQQDFLDFLQHHIIR